MISLRVFFMLHAYKSWDYLEILFLVQKQGNKNSICFIKNKINTLNKNSLFLESPLSCPTTNGDSTATDFLGKFKSKPGKSCSHQTAISMNHQFVFHDFFCIPSLFCSLFCSTFSATALPSLSVAAEVCFQLHDLLVQGTKQASDFSPIPFFACVVTGTGRKQLELNTH